MVIRFSLGFPQGYRRCLRGVWGQFGPLSCGIPRSARGQKIQTDPLTAEFTAVGYQKYTINSRCAFGCEEYRSGRDESTQS